MIAKSLAAKFVYGQLTPHSQNALTSIMETIALNAQDAVLSPDMYVPTIRSTKRQSLRKK